METNKKPKILLGISGSVATIKVVQLIKELDAFADVKLVTTESAKNFYQIDEQDECGQLFDDDLEWDYWHEHKEVLHINLVDWADLMLVAPLSANTMAKVANGICDNLLTCVVRAWDYKKPLIVAPAMNTRMWENLITKKHLDIFEELGIIIIYPIVKKLVCGTTGIGAMEQVDKIVEVVKSRLK